MKARNISSASGLSGFLANLRLLRVIVTGGRIRNTRINTGDLWWAWVDLNHRPRPYQGRVVRFYKNIQDRGDCQTPRKSYKTPHSVGWIVGWKKASIVLLSGQSERECNNAKVSREGRSKTGL
jgi:hypothetical protein